MLTFDTNVLIHAIDAGDSHRRPLAREILLRATRVPSFITQQCIGEFCNVSIKKRLLPAAGVREQVESWAVFYRVVPTRPAQLLAAAELAEGRRKQFWDMVIVRVAADAGATVLLTEDVGDGEVIAGVRIVNPYLPANAAHLGDLLTPSSGP